MKLPPMVHVRWVDAGAVNSSWERMSQAIVDGERIATHHLDTVGFLLGKTKRSVIVGLSVNVHNSDVAFVLTIPRSAVKSITRLK